MNKYLISSVALLALVACTVGPDYKRPALYENKEIADSLKLNTAGAHKVDKEWYKGFNDKTLDSLVAMSQNQSPDIKQAIARLRQARANLKITSVQNLPTIDADGSYNYSKVTGYPISIDYFQTGLDASWELDIWGTGRRQTEAATALYRAAAANIDNVNLSVTAEVAADYINLRIFQEQLRISKQNLKLQEDIYEIVNAKYEAGLDDASALNQAKYAVETTKALIPALENSEEAYKNALAVLLGKLPGTINEQLQAEPKNLIRRRLKLNLNKLYEMPVSVVRLRPDVRIAEYQLMAKNAAIGQAMAQLYPNVSLSGFLGFQSKNIAGLVGDDSFSYNYAPVVNLPLLHWGALTNNVELQKAYTEEYVSLYQSSLLNAAGEIKNAYSGIDTEYRRNQSAKAAVIAQKEVMDLTLERYKQGLIDFNQLLTAEQNLLTAQNAFVASNGAIYQNIISFYKAVGGGYSEKNSDK